MGYVSVVGSDSGLPEIAAWEFRAGVAYIRGKRSAKKSKHHHDNKLNTLMFLTIEFILRFSCHER